MTFSEFRSPYNKCGRVLHRGTIRSIETEQPLQKSDYGQLIQWSHKIVDLLNQHFIGRSDGQALYFATLKTEAGGPACSVLTGFPEGSATVATYNAVESPGSDASTADKGP